MKTTLDEPRQICGTCVSYDSDTCFCSEHPEYGELCEQDTCDDWMEDE